MDYLNETDEATIDEKNFERLVRIIIPTIFGFITVVGFVGNLLVILVVVSNQQMRSTTNILIVSLAVADFLFIVFCVPFTATSYVMPVWPFGNIWCKFSQYMMYVCAYTSVYTLVLMSLDRYLAVVHAIRSMTLRTEKNTYILVFIVWAIVLVTNIPLLFEFRVRSYPYYNQNRSACVNFRHMNDSTGQSAKLFHGFFFGFGYLIPLVIVCVLYGFMLKRLLYGVVPGGNQSAESMRAKKRVTRMVVIVVAIFAFCWLPIQIIFFVHYYGVHSENALFVGVQMASNCLAYMNSCMNPILYAFLSENFRKSFRKLLCCFSAPSLSKNDYDRTNYKGLECAESRTTALQSYNNV
ncbi:allatostatin-A receptor-like [Liolophura sinensis]|uniref:allatostatin-A receptor-like n=1 Tax=Liolophura sinensis TaxID=3198878 RepID=UPI003159931A